MANIDAPFGLRPVRHLDGSAWDGAVQKFLVPASDTDALFIGDAVIGAAAGGSADGKDKYVSKGTVGGNLLGAIVAFGPDRDDLSKQYRVASTLREVYVCTSPDVIFEVQEDSVGNAVTAAEIGCNADMIQTHSGSTVTGQSGMELDSSSAATTAAQLRIVGVARKEDNEIGANAVLEVMINEHEYESTTGTGTP